MKIACQSSLFFFLLHITIRANKIVNSNLQHIIALIAAIFISAALHATNLNKERLTLLQPLVEHDLSFNTNIDITTDSIILWEKLLSPELEKQQEYHILFPLKMMAVQALITEGNISLAVNNANSMYQQAKAIDYPFGTALALRALADTYQSSGNPQSAIESYGSHIFGQRAGETWNAPGVLWAGRINAGGWVESSWGTGAGSVSAQRNDRGEYQINHNIGHTEYFVMITCTPYATDNSAWLFGMIRERYSGHFTLMTVDATRGNKDMAFEVAIIGRNKF